MEDTPNYLSNKQSWKNPKNKWNKSERDRTAKALREIRNSLNDIEERPYSGSEMLSRVLLIILAVLLILVAGCFLSRPAHAEMIDLNKIASIESSGCKHKNGDSGQSIGCYQVKDALIEWNQFHPKEKYSKSQMMDDRLCLKVADWYLHNRIPQMLRAFKKPVTKRNVLIAYNAGISYVVKNKTLPENTISYLRKYGVA